MPYSETDFQKFQEWFQTINIDNYSYYNSGYRDPITHAVIDYFISIETKELGHPQYWYHQDFEVEQKAENFVRLYQKWELSQQKYWLKTGLKNSTFKTEYEQGNQDGYWLQPKRMSTEAYLYGYREGLFLKRKQGYDVYETNTGALPLG